MPDAPRRYAPRHGIAREFRAKKPKSAAARGYGHQWQVRSRVWLDAMYESYVEANPEQVHLLPGYYTPSGERRLNPPCIDCLREGVVFGGDADNPIVVDHETPHRGDQGLFWDESNWRPRCKRHHDVKTVTRDGGLGRPVMTSKAGA